MTEKKPEFRLDFNGFATFGNRVEASLIVSPEFELVGVTDIHHSEDTVRALTFIFQRTNPHQLGRRIFSLKKEFEQLPTGEITFDSANSLPEKSEENNRK